MTYASDYDSWLGCDVYDVSDSKIGKVDEIFYDDRTHRPEWITVTSGMFGTKRHFVPILGSSRTADGDLRVNYDTGMVKNAPNMDVDNDHLDADQEIELYRYYNIDWDDSAAAFASGQRADVDYEVRPYETTTESYATPVEQAVETETMTTRSEVPRVETQTGTVRLRKYRVTEQVPVTREEVRVEREADVVDETR